MVHIPLPDLGLDFTASELRTAFLGKHIANLHAANGWHVIRAASSQSSDRGEHLGNLGAAWQGGLWPGDGVNDGVDAEFPARAALNHVRTIDARMLQLSRQRGTAFSLQTAAGSDGNNHFLRGRGFLQESDAFAKRMEDGDEQALGFIGRLQDLWFAECARHYKRLGIEFDTYIGHASGIPNMTKRLERPLAARGIAFQRDDGTTILDFDAHPAPTTPTTNAQGMAAASRTDKQPSKLGVHILRNASGTTTQLLRDAAAVLALVEEYDLDKLIMVTGADTGGTTQHYQRVSRTLTLAGHGEVAEKLVHVPCGVPTVGVPGLETTGSSGIGTSVTPTGSGGGGGLDDLPDIVTAEVLEPLEMMRGAYCIDYNTVEAEGDGSPAEILATAALAVSELTPRRGGSVRGQTQVFNLEALASLDGEDSGPALQLVYSRLRRRLALLSLTTATNYHVPGPHEDDFDDDDADAILRPVLCSKAALAELRTTPWVDLLRLLARYPDVVIGAKGTGDPSVYDTFEPCLLLQFLFRVVGDVREVLDEADDVDAGLGGEANGFTVIGGSGRGESSSAGSARGEREAAVRAVLEAVRVVIENGCELLGVPLIEVEAVRAARERQAVGKRVEREQ